MWKHSRAVYKRVTRWSSQYSRNIAVLHTICKRWAHKTQEGQQSWKKMCLWTRKKKRNFKFNGVDHRESCFQSQAHSPTVDGHGVYYNTSHHWMS